MSINGLCGDSKAESTNSSAIDQEDYAQKIYIDTKFDQLVQRSGDRMNGDLNMFWNFYAGLAKPTRPLLAVNKQYFDSTAYEQVSKQGDFFKTGDLTMKNNLIRG